MIRFWCQLGSILSTILKNNKILIDFGIVILSILVPTWLPTWAQLGFQDGPKFQKMAPTKIRCSSQKRVRNTTFNFNTVLDRLGLDFGGSWGGFWDPRRPQDPPKTPLRRPEPPLRWPQTPQRRPKPPPRCQELAKAKKQPKTKPKTKPYPRRPKT